MKLTFCPVDLPENQDIETIDFENYGLLKISANLKLKTEWAKNQNFVAVIWNEYQDELSTGALAHLGSHFHILHDSIFKVNDVLNMCLKHQDEEDVVSMNINIFCFATSEEAFDYAKDYCHGVWPSPEDSLN